MKKLLSLVLLILVTLIGMNAIMFPAPAASSQPTRITEYIDATVKSKNWTNRCQFPVYIHQQGTVTSVLFSSSDGTQLVSEIDTSPGFKVTYFSPISVPGGTGGSYTGVSGVATRTTFPDGADLGAPAFMAFNGLQILFPDLPQAGRDFWLGEVAYITPEGIPLVDLLAPISIHGTFSELADVIAALCGRLSAP